MILNLGAVHQSDYENQINDLPTIAELLVSLVSKNKLIEKSNVTIKKGAIQPLDALVPVKLSFEII